MPDNIRVTSSGGKVTGTRSTEACRPASSDAVQKGLPTRALMTVGSESGIEKPKNSSLRPSSSVWAIAYSGA